MFVKIVSPCSIIDNINQTYFSCVWVSRWCDYNKKLSIIAACQVSEQIQAFVFKNNFFFFLTGMISLTRFFLFFFFVCWFYLLFVRTKCRMLTPCKGVGISGWQSHVFKLKKYVLVAFFLMKDACKLTVK